jgi:hypothetical protein
LTTEELDELYQDYPDLVGFTGFDGAILGVVERFGTEAVLLYDYEKCIDILVFEGMSYEDACDYFSFNVIGAWVGDYTPAFAHLR